MCAKKRKIGLTQVYFEGGGGLEKTDPLFMTMGNKKKKKKWRL